MSWQIGGTFTHEREREREEGEREKEKRKTKIAFLRSNTDQMDGKSRKKEKFLRLAGSNVYLNKYCRLC